MLNRAAMYNSYNVLNFYNTQQVIRRKSLPSVDCLLQIGTRCVRLALL